MTYSLNYCIPKVSTQEYLPPVGGALVRAIVMYVHHSFWHLEHSVQAHRDQTVARTLLLHHEKAAKLFVRSNPDPAGISWIGAAVLARKSIWSWLLRFPVLPGTRGGGKVWIPLGIRVWEAESGDPDFRSARDLIRTPADPLKGNYPNLVT